MPIRMSGMMSGMDTDSIVQSLMSAHRMKQTKISNKKQLLEWKKELWGDMNTKILNFYKGSLSKLKMQSTFKTKSAVSSDTSKITATANANAAEGTYKIKVNSVASSQYVTSGKLAGAREIDDQGNPTGNTVKVSNSTKLVDLLDNSGNTTFTKGTQITIKGADGTNNATLFVDENTTVADFVATAQSAGLTASFDASQQRFFLSSGKSGDDQKFTITSAALTQQQQDAIAGWKEAVGYNYLSSGDKAAVSKLFDGLQTGTVTYGTEVEEQLKGYVAKAQETGVTSYYKNRETERLNNLYFSDADHKNVTAAGKQAYIDAGVADGHPAAGLEDSWNKMTDEQKATAVAGLVATSVNEYMDSASTKADIATGISSGIAGASDPFLVASNSQREANINSAAQNFNSVMSSLADNSSQMAGLGITAVDGSAVAEGTDAAGLGMVVVKAQNASVTVNGATLTSEDSTLTVNGLTLNILDSTEGKEISITVSKDTSAVYDTIKDFISEYNSILKSMNTSYNASTARGYDPLTDDQKKAMTDDEIEKWESKIKSSLLRRDNTMSGLISSFRNNMMGSYKASDGKTYSLASLGITTSTDYKEGGLLHIKGDEDDDVFGDEENKLQKMLDEDPELVMEILTGLSNNLYEDLKKKMASTSMSSAMTFYNDKEMNSQLSDYAKDIKKWDAKLNALEDKYYKQFTAMEKAMASMQSQQNALAGFFG